MAAAATNSPPGNAIPPPLCSPINQVVDNQYWILLTLGHNIHGTQSMKDMLIIKLLVTTNGKLFHSWVATAKPNKNCKTIPKFVWERLLGSCVEGCTHPCNRETNIDELDITSLINIYNYAEHIIPSNILLQANIINLKMKYKDPVESIRKTRNELAHHSLKKNMSKREFHDRWNKIRNTLGAMDYDKSKIIEFNSLETCSLDPHRKQISMSFIDTMNVLEVEKCDRSELESFISIVYSHIKKCQLNDTEIKDLKCNLGIFATFFILLICINLSK